MVLSTAILLGCIGYIKFFHLSDANIAASHLVEVQSMVVAVLLFGLVAVVIG
jgi:hypothetical protein